MDCVLAGTRGDIPPNCLKTPIVMPFFSPLFCATLSGSAGEAQTSALFLDSALEADIILFPKRAQSQFKVQSLSDNLVNPKGAANCNIGLSCINVYGL